jgi:GTPase SAR1 family protein
MSTQLTVGIDFYTYDIPLIVKKNNTTIRLTIWDFGGQERFKSLFKYYIGGVHGIFLVFDLVQMQSLINLDWWYDRLKEVKVLDRPSILIGTKLDLFEQDDKNYGIDQSLINNILERYSVDTYIKTSSKDNINIQNAFMEMTKKILDHHRLEYE